METDACWEGQTDQFIEKRFRSLSESIETTDINLKDNACGQRMNDFLWLTREG